MQNVYLMYVQYVSDARSRSETERGMHLEVEGNPSGNERKPVQKLATTFHM